MNIDQRGLKDLSRIQDLSRKLRSSLDCQSDQYRRSPTEFENLSRARQTLRNDYLDLLFNIDPTSQQQSNNGSSSSLELLNLLWLDTTHAFISGYRRQITYLEKSIKNAHHHQLIKSTDDNDNDDDSLDQANSSFSIPGPVAKRKWESSFRCFLNSELGFWKQLISKFIQTFNLQNATHLFNILKVSNNTPDPLLLSLRLPVIQNSPSNSFTESPFARVLVHKALICLGDLTRYRELYSSRPTSTSSRPRPLTKTQNALPRDWSKAAECYNQARLLLPSNGNPSNQLAVLASYLSDHLTSAYHYFRALSVKDPFPTASQNLKLLFIKTLKKWSESQPGPQQQNLLVSFQVEFMALHAILFTHNMFDRVTTSNLSVCALLSQALQKRSLPPSLILKVVIISMAAVWNLRVIRKKSVNQHSKLSCDLADPLIVELATTTHLIDLLTTFLNVAIAELTSIPSLSSSSSPTSPHPKHPQDLSLSIPAVLRRILPSLRLISKWILSGNLGYLKRLSLRLEAKHSIVADSDRVDFRNIVQNFKTQFAKFTNILTLQFPVDQLPALDQDMWLEEDLDIMGFLPLQKGMTAGSGASLKPSSSVLRVGMTVHPNEEYLMRVGDVIRDAQLIDAALASPGPQAYEPQLVSEFKDVAGKPDASLEAPLVDEPAFIPERTRSRKIWSSEDGMGSEHEEDPVEMAMRAVVAHQMCQEDCDDDHDDHDDGDDWGDGDDNDDDAEEGYEGEREPNVNVERLQPADLDEEEDEQVVYVPTALSTPSRPSKLSGLSSVSPSTSGTRRTSPTTAFPTAYGITPPTSLNIPPTTAADLLASITRQPAPRASAISQAPASPSGWSSLALTTYLYNNATPDGRTGPRAPSISLPKPAESNLGINIWANCVTNGDALSVPIGSSSLATPHRKIANCANSHKVETMPIQAVARRPSDLGMGLERDLSSIWNSSDIMQNKEQRDMSTLRLDGSGSHDLRRYHQNDISLVMNDSASHESYHYQPV